MRILRNSVLVTAAFAMAATPIVAQASTPNELKDLVGARGSSGESQLQARGYVYKSGAPSANGINTYYWNASKKTCVKVYTTDGRYASIDSVGASDCGEKGGSNTAAIAVGAAAAVGIAALIASSGKNKDKAQDYQRGYDDGYYNRRYGSTGNGSEYSKGFNDGVAAGRNGGYGSGHDYYNQNSYNQYTGWNDLKGQDSNYAFDALRQRGWQFIRETDGEGGGHQQTYWQPQKRECINIHTAHNQIDNIWSVNKRRCR